MTSGQRAVRERQVPTGWTVAWIGGGVKELSLPCPQWPGSAPHWFAPGCASHGSAWRTPHPESAGRGEIDHHRRVVGKPLFPQRMNVGALGVPEQGRRGEQPIEAAAPLEHLHTPAATVTLLYATEQDDRVERPPRQLPNGASCQALRLWQAVLDCGQRATVVDGCNWPPKLDHVLRWDDGCTI